MKGNKIIFYSLLYFSNKDINPNLSVLYKKNKDKIYILNALNLNSSLKKHNVEYVLLTNNKKKIEKFSKDKINIKELKFNQIFKKKINFYSAHFKIEVIKFLSKQKNQSCLLDLDMLAVNNFPNYLKIAAKKKINLVYNINNKKNLTTNRKILRTLNFCNLRKDNTYDWYGGEFIFGNSKFFSCIYYYIKKILPNYKKNLSKFHHVGDETLINAALQIIRNEKKIKFKETNLKNIVSRFWSINTIIKQKSINYHLKHFLIHLPADKVFLSKINVDNMTVAQIKKEYRSYLNSPQKKLFEKIKKIIF